LFRLWRRSRMWLRFSDSFPFQFRFLAWWKKLLWELLQQPPPPQAGTPANAGKLVITAPAAVAISMPPATHVFLSTFGLLLSEWRDGPHEPTLSESSESVASPNIPSRFRDKTIAG
jgi:hypothetical protein